MFEHINNLVATTADTLRAEGERLIEQAHRSMTRGVLFFVSLVTAVVSLGAILVAGVATLSMYTGWIVALAIGGVAGLGASVGACILLWPRSREEAERPQSVAAAQSPARLNESSRPTASTPLPETPRSESQGDEDSKQDWKDLVAEFAVRNPALSVAGVSALVALLGPGKSIKFAGRAVMLASMASKVAEHLADANETTDERTPSAERETRTSC